MSETLRRATPVPTAGVGVALSAGALAPAGRNRVGTGLGSSRRRADGLGGDTPGGPP